MSLLTLFRYNGAKFNECVTEGQLVIFCSLVFKISKRTIIICPTQYGKSFIVALALLVMTCIQGRRCVVVAPTAEKAKEIMRYYIEHLGDSPLLYQRLEKDTKLDRLRQEESKERIILNNGGGVFILSVDQRNSKKNFEAAMGKGAEDVIMDEAALIDDTVEATVFRMIAGKGAEATYTKIGNPFNSGHFKRDWEGTRYLKVYLDYVQALKEGRYTPEFVDEALGKPLSDVLYRCEFPTEDVIDARGYRQLVTAEQIKYGVVVPEGVPKLGIDVGGGGDLSTFCVRWTNCALMAATNNSSDTMVNVAEAQRVVTEYGIPWDKVFIDDIGIGRGVSDRLKELGFPVHAVSAGEAARNKQDFFNVKAEMYWDCKKWVEEGGVFSDTEALSGKKTDLFQQLTWIKYKESSNERQIRIEPKEELKRRTGKSPDGAEALMLTFYKPLMSGIFMV